MRHTFALSLVLASLLKFFASAQREPVVQLTGDDATRVSEFYRLATAIQDGLWPGWSSVSAPLMLVTDKAEFLTHFPSPPPEFKKIEGGWYVRPRQFPVEFQATFPAFGPPSVIVIGEPGNTLSKSSTPWLFTVMHEHFHQLQNAQPEYTAAVNHLGLSKGDTTGMWMLNYPFPYEKPEIAQSFARLRDLLLRVLAEKDSDRFEKMAHEYIEERRKFFASLNPDDHRYLGFQLWQEGIARYTEVRSAEAAALYHPTREFENLPDYEPVSGYAQQTREKTFDELKRADLRTWKRTVVYSFGAAEGFLLDRLNPKWKSDYFKQMLSTDSYFGTHQ